jgi:hypothetical protein
VLKNKDKKGVDSVAIKAFCRGKIAHYKVIHFFIIYYYLECNTLQIPDHVMFVDAFPLTITGKIQKYIHFFLL